MKTIFLSSSETRLRSGWRLILQSVLLGAILVCTLFPFVFNLELLNSGKGLLLSQVAEFFGITVSVFLARRFLDKRSFKSLGFKMDRRAFADLAAGFGISSLMMALVFILEKSMGWLTIIDFAWERDSFQKVWSQTLLYLFAYILVGWNEELLSRGYHLQTLADGLGLKWAVLTSSIIFGVLHISNPNATWIGAAGIFFAGIFLAFGYIRTKQLWLPIGLHIGWNFFEGVVFGFPVSGTQTYRLINILVDGPELWTGGLFGPEAGLVMVPVLLMGILMIYRYTHGRDWFGNQVSNNSG